jgi:hypothetical protein
MRRQPKGKNLSGQQVAIWQAVEREGVLRIGEIVQAVYAGGATPSLRASVSRAVARLLGRGLLARLGRRLMIAPNSWVER